MKIEANNRISVSELLLFCPFQKKCIVYTSKISSMQSTV